MITVAAPLLDKNGDGIVVLSKEQAKRLGLAAGTPLVLHRIDAIGAHYLLPGEVAPTLVTPPAAPVTGARKTGGPSAKISGYGDGLVEGEWYERLMVAVPIARPMTGLTIADLRIDVCRELLLQKTRGARLTDARLARIAAGIRKRGALLRGASNALIEDIDLWMVGEPETSTGTFPVGLQFGAKVKDSDDSVRATVRRFKIGGFRTDYGPKEYQQGGGITAEAGGSITLGDGEVFDCDEMLDLKPSWAIPRPIVLRGGTRHLKVWGSGTATHVTSIDPVKPVPGLGPTTDMLAQGTSDPKLYAIPSYVIDRLDFLGDAPRKHIAGRSGAFFDLVIKETNLDPRKLVIDYVGKGANITVAGVELRRRG